VGIRQVLGRSKKTATPASPAERSRPPVRWTTKAILLASSLLFTLLVIEVVLRVIGYAPFEPVVDGRQFIIRTVTDGSDARYELTPGAKGHAFQTDVEVSSQGFRDREYAPVPPPYTLRIVVLGDSISFGQKMPARDTYADQLEQLFASEQKPIEVINASVSGYDTLDEIAALERRGIALQPHLVVLGYCINDITDASPDAHYLKRLADYGSWIYRLRIAQLVQAKVDAIRAKHAERDDRRYLNVDRQTVISVAADPALREAFQLLATYKANAADRNGWRARVFAAYASFERIAWLRTNFDRLAQLARQHRFKVIVVPLPFLDESEGQRPFVEATYAMVSHEASRAGFATLRVDQRFRDAGLERLHIGPSDYIHFSRAGHTIVAQALHDLIVEGTL
jgi:lysophospholipase L1-like esterase